MQKVLLIALTFIFVSATCFAQSKAPKAVVAAFNEKFPNATKVKWDKENDKEYEAEFEWQGASYSANFGTKGNWIETEKTVAFASLPLKVQESYNNSNKGSKVKAAAKIDSSDGTVKYEVEFKKGLKTVEVMYDEGGKVVKM